MEILQQSYLGNSLEKWLIAFSIFVSIFLALKAIQFFSAKGISTKTRSARLAEIVLLVMKSTKSFFLSLLAAAIALQAVHVHERAATALQKTLMVVFALQLGIWCNAIINFYVREYSNAYMAKDASKATTVTALSLLVKILAWALVILLALNNIGVNITALVAGLGVGGIAMALAVQNILGDILASLSIILDKPFVIGDMIAVGTDSGTVEHIGLKTTRLRSITGEQLIFSNSDLLKSRIRNYKRLSERRIEFVLSLDYSVTKEKLEKVPMLVRSRIETLAQARFERCNLVRFSPTTLDFETVYYVQSLDFKTYMEIQEKINLSLLEAFRTEDIKIPPHAAAAPIAITEKV